MYIGNLGWIYMDSEKRKKGLEMMDRLDPTATARLKESLRDIAPDLADYVVDFAYGDVIARPGLDLRSREIATISALTAMGNAEPELKIHLKKALHIGIPKEELVELMIHLLIYAGFPASINGMLALKAVLAEK